MHAQLTATCSDKPRFDRALAGPAACPTGLASQQRSLRRAARRRSIDLSDLQRGGSAASSWGGLSDLASTHSAMWDPFSSLASRTSIDTLLRTMSRWAASVGGRSLEWMVGWAMHTCAGLPTHRMHAGCPKLAAMPLSGTGERNALLRPGCSCLLMVPLPPAPPFLRHSVGHMLGSPTSTMRRAGSVLFRDDFGIGLATSWLHPHGGRCE